MQVGKTEEIRHPSPQSETGYEIIQNNTKVCVNGEDWSAPVVNPASKPILKDLLKMAAKLPPIIAGPLKVM